MGRFENEWKKFWENLIDIPTHEDLEKIYEFVLCRFQKLDVIETYIERHSAWDAICLIKAELNVDTVKPHFVSKEEADEQDAIKRNQSLMAQLYIEKETVKELRNKLDKINETLDCLHTMSDRDALKKISTSLADIKPVGPKLSEETSNSLSDNQLHAFWAPVLESFLKNDVLPAIKENR